MSAEPQQLLFPADGGEKTFTVSGNIGFDLSIPDVEWFSCTAADDGVFVVTVVSNEGEEDRTGCISITNEDYEREIEVNIVQPRSDYFELLTPSFELGPEGGEIEVEIATNIDYSYTVSEEWLEDAGNLKFAAGRNLDAEERSATINFSAAGESYVVNISQTAPYLTLTETSFELDSLGGQIAFGVSSNISYTVDIPESDWVSCSGSEGEYVLVVANNDDYRTRTYSITFEAADFNMSRTVTVTQTGNEEARPFSLKNRDSFIGPTGGELKIIHTKCNDVSVSVYNAGWIREIPSRRNDTTLVFSVDTLFTEVDRQAIISVIGKGRTVTGYVFQNPALMVLTYNEKRFPDTGGTASIEMTSNITPEFYTDQDWVTGSAAEDRSSITFVVEPNDTGLERTAVVEVGLKRLNYLQEVTIVQAANDMIVLDPSEIEAETTGGDFYVRVSANVKYSVMGSADWVSCAATDEENVIRISVEPNQSAMDRSTSLMFSGGKAKAYLSINQAGYRNPDYYYSEDYSQNKTAVRLQTATTGSGIPLVLMGDAFSDRLIADGTYAEVMNRAMESFFAIEPFTTFRNMFDVWYINVVSPNEIYADDATTALSTSFVQGTVVTGNHSAVRNLALWLLDPIAIKKTLMVVVMNTPTYGGTTYLYDYIGSVVADYGVGESIAYIPLCTSEEQFTRVLQHEVGGHGFGKLQDEYYYDSYGTIPEDRISQIRLFQQNGFDRNVDFTSDPEQVLWAKFITDRDYQYEGIGVFEGACFYPYGAYRPTEESIMCHTVGGFNAPSREAIFYRLNKLAFGASCQYSYEAFKQYDVINRKTSPSASQSSNRPGRNSDNPIFPEPLPAPVFIK